MGAVCITYDDVPKKVYNERQVSIPERTYRDRTVLPDIIRHVGEGVMAVAAPTEALAEKALATVKVEYDVITSYSIHYTKLYDLASIWRMLLSSSGIPR